MPPRTPEDEPEPQDPSEAEEAPPPSPARRAKIEALKAELLGDLLTAAEVAEILDVHPRTVGEYLREGKLSGIQLAGGWRVSEKSLRDFVQEAASGGGMFKRFTDKARHVIVLAQTEARRLDHNYIGTEHLLLGLLAEGEGVGARALVELGVSLKIARIQVESAIGRGTESPGGYIPFTPRAKKALELSLREALTLGHNYIGTEHLLLGLIREGGGVAAQILTRPGGVELDNVRAKVIQLLSGGLGSLRATTPAGAEGALRRQWAPAMEAKGLTTAKDGSGRRRLKRRPAVLDPLILPSKRAPEPKPKAVSKPKTKPQPKKLAKPKPAKRTPRKSR